jgi:hypothetical protein
MSPGVTDRLDRLGLAAAEELRTARQATTDVSAARMSLGRTIRRRRVMRGVIVAVVLAVLTASLIHLRVTRLAPTHPPVHLAANGAIATETLAGMTLVNPITGVMEPIRALANHDPSGNDGWLPVAFSPDGRRLLIHGSGRTAVLDLSSGDVTSVMGADEGQDAGHPAFSMAWSPDGRRLATIAPDGTLRIDTVGRASGSALLQVTATRTFKTGVRGAVNTAMAWSPDGTRIGFIGLREDERWTSDLYVVSADGTGLRRLHATAPGNVGEQHGPASLAWSPDGARLAFLEYFGSGEPASSHMTRLELIRPDGTGKTFVTSIPFPGGEACDCYKFNPPRMAWAPDGTAIAFESEEVPAPFVDGLFIASLGGSVRNVARSRDFFGGVAWQPVLAPPRPTPVVDQPFTSRPVYPADQRALTRTTTLDGLRITTSGPLQVLGGGGPLGPGGGDGTCLAFTVQVRLTNTTATTWAGTVGVGLYGARTDPTFGTEMLYALHAGCGEARPYWFEHGASPGHWIQGIIDPNRHRLRPGRSITLVIGMVKAGLTVPQVWVRGWIPVIDPIDPRTPVTNTQAAYPDPTGYPTVDWQ